MEGPSGRGHLACAFGKPLIGSVAGIMQRCAQRRAFTGISSKIRLQRSSSKR
jgi:hypothetical protein